MRLVGHIAGAFRMRGIGTQSHSAARSGFTIGFAVTIIERHAGRLDLVIPPPRIITRSQPVVVLAASLAFNAYCQQNYSGKNKNRQGRSDSTAVAMTTG